MIAALLAALLALPAAGGGDAPRGRLIVLGIDGGDARTVEALMRSGALPNLAALAEKGTFGALATANPAESPVSWSCLNTGQNPAKTGIPGFVVRAQPGSGKGAPSPTMGFQRTVQRPLERVRGAPIPSWSSATLGLACGAAVLGVFLAVFGFLLRLRRTPALVLSLSLAGLAAWGGVELRGYLPSSYPVVENPLEATPFWETAAQAGVACIVLDGAQSWDREDVEGARVLAGLGVPDARGSYNGFSLYTSDEFEFGSRPGDSTTPSAGERFRLEERGGAWHARVWGPANFWRRAALSSELAEVERELAEAASYKRSVELSARKDELQASLAASAREPLSVPLEVRLEETAARVSIGGQEQTLTEGAWSDWYSLTFELNPLVKVRALARAKVLKLSDPHFELYLDALQIDPAHPPFWQPISQPPSFAPELARAWGPYETVGWACMNLPLKDGAVDPVSFLEDIQFTYEWRRGLTLECLRRNDWRILVSCLSTPDRVQHMMYQHYDPAHPLHRPEEAARTLSFFGETVALRDAIPAIYRAIDRLVGEVARELRPEDTLILCADHGFQSFRRQVHVNNWLHAKGYLALKDGLQRGAGDFASSYVDWSRTKAYSIGLGMVYLNLRGREGQGIVDPSEAPALLAEIGRDFLALVDESAGGEGTRACASALPSRAIHQGPHLDREADLLLGFAPGYRVSWQTTLGGIHLVQDADGRLTPGPAIVDNDKSWSGDHVSVDPEQVKGLFFCNRRLRIPEGGLDLRHVAPTVLAFAGVAIPPEYDLPPLEILE